MHFYIFLCFSRDYVNVLYAKNVDFGVFGDIIQIMAQQENGMSVKLQGIPFCYFYLWIAFSLTVAGGKGHLPQKFVPHFRGPRRPFPTLKFVLLFCLWITFFFTVTGGKGQALSLH